MNTTRPKRGRALFYTRDSGGKHEMTPGKYVEWAQNDCLNLSLSFDGTPDGIESMITRGDHVLGDLFLDYGTKGNILTRKGLDNFIFTATADTNVSHCYIPRRDRLARPDDPIDGVQLESLLSKAGIELKFMNRTVPARQVGKRPDISELLVALIDYDRAGEDRRELARKMIEAQIALASSGFSTGGNPPHGFRRWLVDANRSPVRELERGERVRKPGHHVVWLPTANEELCVVRRILDMLPSTRAPQVAKILTAEGIPTPYAGRTRTDKGVKHVVSGVWHANTVTAIARNPLLVATVTYGKWSFGDQLRYSAGGPRELELEDFRPDNKPKVVRNSEADIVQTPASFDPIVDPKAHAKLIAELDRRGASQRGVPRSRDPDNNPLGCRIFDQNCGWPMYRGPYKDAYRYVCGLYEQSARTDCAHNWISGPLAVQFVIGCIRQRLCDRGARNRLEHRLRQLADRDQPDDCIQLERESVERRLIQLNEDMEKVGRNLAFADGPEKYAAVENVFDELKGERQALQAKLAELDASAASPQDRDEQLREAVAKVERIANTINCPEDPKRARQIIDDLNIRLFLRFEPRKIGKRTLNKISGGVLTFGDTPPPIQIHEGRTGKAHFRGQKKKQKQLENDGNGVVAEREGELCGKGSCGDRI